MEKNEVVNAQVLRMTNEHEQLTIKFDNLQGNLEFFSSEGDKQLKKEIVFLKEQEINVEKVKSLEGVFEMYH